MDEDDKWTDIDETLLSYGGNHTTRKKSGRTTITEIQADGPWILFTLCVITVITGDIEKCPQNMKSVL